MGLTENLSTIVAVLIALSVATERLVDIIKGLIPFLNQKNDDPKKEGWRRTVLQGMGFLGGIVTALLCQPALSGVMPEAWNSLPGILALGLLASGGSGFWSSIQSYVLNAKDAIKAAGKAPAAPSS